MTGWRAGCRVGACPITASVGGRGADLISVFKDLSEAVRHSAAMSTLSGLMTWIGEAGLAATATVPGLMALVDQHAAGVRDALGDPEQGPGVAGLAGYANGVRDTAYEHGWQMPDANHDWSTADWATLRLVAICSLSRTLGYA